MWAWPDKFLSLLLAATLQFSACPESPRMAWEFTFSGSRAAALDSCRDALELLGYQIDIYAPESHFLTTRSRPVRHFLRRYDHVIALRVSDRIRMFISAEKFTYQRGSEWSLLGREMVAGDIQDQLPYRVQLKIVDPLKQALRERNIREYTFNQSEYDRQFSLRLHILEQKERERELTTLERREQHRLQKLQSRRQARDLLQKRQADSTRAASRGDSERYARLNAGLGVQWSDADWKTLERSLTAWVNDGFRRGEPEWAYPAPERPSYHLALVLSGPQQIIDLDGFFQSGVRSDRWTSMQPALRIQDWLGIPEEQVPGRLELLVVPDSGAVWSAMILTAEPAQEPLDALISRDKQVILFE